MKHLTSEQRYEIYLGRKRGWSRSRIAGEIGVHPSTVSRELTRNANSNGEYVWINAHAKSEARKQSIEGNHRKPQELWWRIDQMIVEEDWSPAQIAGVLRKEGIHIVKQTIYNHVHADTSGRLAPHMPHELKYTRRNKASR
ncbi:helix-turn-helix domain-containing protein, partial [Heminiphilus faecis]